MANIIRICVEEKETIVLGVFLVFNLLVACITRGGITLLANVAYGASLLAIITFGAYNYIKRRQEERSWLRILLVLFLALFLLSYNYSLNKGYGLSELILFGSGSLLCVYLSGQPSLKKTSLETIFRIITVSAGIFTLIGYYVYLTYPLDRFASIFYNFDDKFIGFPNALADYLIIALPLSIYFLLKSPEGKIKIFNGAQVALIISGLYLTYSRGGYLSAIAPMAIFAWVFRKEIFKKQIIKTGVIILVSIITVILLANTIRDIQYEVIDIGEKVTLSADEKAGSVNERVDFYNKSISISKDFFWTGVGSDGFQFIYPRYQEYPFATSSHPHNLFLKIAVENGTPTSVILFFFFITVIYKGIKQKNQLVQVATLAILGLLIHNQIDYNLNFVPLILILFLFAGIIINQKKREIRTMPVATILVTVFGLFLVGLSLHEGYYNQMFQDGRKMIEEKKYEAAITNLEKSEKLVFPRRLYSSLAETKGKLEQYTESIESYQTAILVNSMDANAKNALGEMFNKIGLTDIAKDQFAQALDNDPQNFLRFHYNWLATTGEIQTDVIEKYYKRLDQFTLTLANNEHNIILTDNPEYAIKIAQLLLEKTRDRKFEDLRTKLSQLKDQEENKFKQKFSYKFPVSN